jgi:hypothetical protein
MDALDRIAGLERSFGLHREVDTASPRAREPGAGPPAPNIFPRRYGAGNRTQSGRRVTLPAPRVPGPAFTLSAGNLRRDVRRATPIDRLRCGDQGGGNVRPARIFRFLFGSVARTAQVLISRSCRFERRRVIDLRARKRL